MPTIVHFEVPADDIERSRKFYTDLFGWNIKRLPSENLPPEGTEYWVINTTDDQGNKSVGGGMYKRHEPEQQGILNFIDVSSNYCILIKVTYIYKKFRLYLFPSSYHFF